MAKRKKYQNVKGVKRPKRLKKPSADRARRALMSAALGWHVCSTVLEKVLWRTKHQMEAMMGLKVLKPIFFLPLIITGLPMFTMMMPAFCLAQCVTTLQSVVAFHVIKDRLKIILAERRGVFDRFNQERAIRKARTTRKKSSTMEWVRKNTKNLTNLKRTKKNHKDDEASILITTEDESVGSDTVDMSSSSTPGSVATSSSHASTKSSAVQRPQQHQEELRGMASMRQQTMRLLMGDLAVAVTSGEPAQGSERPNIIQLRGASTSSIGSGTMNDLALEDSDIGNLDGNKVATSGERDGNTSSTPAASVNSTNNAMKKNQQPAKRSRSFVMATNSIRRMRSFHKPKETATTSEEAEEDLDATARICNHRKHEVPPQRSMSLVGLVNPMKLRRNSWSKKSVATEQESSEPAVVEPLAPLPPVLVLSSMGSGIFHGSGQFDRMDQEQRQQHLALAATTVP